MDTLLIKSAKVTDKRAAIEGAVDILIKEGIVAEIAPHITSDAETLDAKDLKVLPGLIDVHVHLREPGREDEETVLTGSRAATKGGFTQVFAMPNTDPIADSPYVIRYVTDKARDAGYCWVHPVAAITKGSSGEVLTDMSELAENGAVAFSDDGAPVSDPALLRTAMTYAGSLGKVIIIHAEDRSLSMNGQINAGFTATRLGLKGIPASAEETMIARDIILAGETGAKVHFAHVSTAGSVELVRRGKASGIDVTCEVSPHHLALTDECLAEYDTNFKVNPPLRSQRDVEALKEGLADGTIDMIASDHAPHSRFEKDAEFEFAPFGLIGLETSLSVVVYELIEKNVVSLDQVAELMCSNAAARFGLQAPILKVGSIADLTLIDLSAKRLIDVEKFESQSRNCPFNGWELPCEVRHVITTGRLLLKDGNIIDRTGTVPVSIQAN